MFGNNLTELLNSLTRLTTLLETSSPAALAALQAPNQLAGTAAADDLSGTVGTDVIDGDAGDDILTGFSGNDFLTGGDGADQISGDAGNDILRGGNGADVFIIDPSHFGGGNDIIRDFSIAEDTLQFELGSLLAADPQLALQAAAPGDTPDDAADDDVTDDAAEDGATDDGVDDAADDAVDAADDAADDATDADDDAAADAADGVTGGVAADDDDQAVATADDDAQAIAQIAGDDLTLSVAALDNSDAFSITESANGFVQINHPNGAVELENVQFAAENDSFAELASFMTIVDERPEGSQILSGQADIEENISGGTGDDVLVGGAGVDNFQFNPNLQNGGDDIYADFNPQEDVIAAEIANLLAADSTLAGAATGGDPTLVELADLDASDSFFIFPSGDNFVTIGSANGTAMLSGVQFDTTSDSFAELSQFFELRNTIDQPTPEEEAVTGFIEATTPVGGVGTGGTTAGGTATNGTGSATGTGTAADGTGATAGTTGSTATADDTGATAAAGTVGDTPALTPTGTGTGAGTDMTPPADTGAIV